MPTTPKDTSTDPTEFHKARTRQPADKEAASLEKSMSEKDDSAADDKSRNKRQPQQSFKSLIPRATMVENPSSRNYSRGTSDFRRAPTLPPSSSSTTMERENHPQTPWAAIQNMPFGHELQDTHVKLPLNRLDAAMENISRCLISLHCQYSYFQNRAAVRVKATEQVELRVVIWKSGDEEVVVDVKRRQGDAVVFQAFAHCIMEAAQGRFNAVNLLTRGPSRALLLQGQVFCRFVRLVLEHRTADTASGSVPDEVRVSHNDRCSVDPARPPEPWPVPEIHAAATNIPVAVVVNDGSAIERQHVCLVKRDIDGASRRCAYQRIPHRLPIPLGEDGARGQVVICVVLEESDEAGSGVFQEPSEDEAQLVAIKQLRKRVYSPRSRTMVSIYEANENPLSEIAAMRYLNPQVSPNHPVAGCLEALENEEHLFIVMPYIHGGELHGHIPWADRRPNIQHLGIPENEAKVVFGKILRALDFLHSRGVCHCDFKNENIVMNSGGKLGEDAMEMQEVPLVDMEPTIIDMAMSLRIQQDADGNFYKLTNTRGPCGTPPFMAPEVLQSSATLDGFAVDVWACGVILFNLLTGRRLYERPWEWDLQYKHFVLKGGLVDDDLNNKFLRKAQRLVAQQRPQSFAWLRPLLDMILVIQQLHPTTRILLQGMLCPDPDQRFTLPQVMQHEWFET